MTITANELLITEALNQRAARPRDLSREVTAINDLARGMVRQPKALQRRFVELALDLCRAGSAGISMLEDGSAGEQLFRWTALAGQFGPYVGGTTPRHFSPCGLCLDQHHTILLERPGRVFDYLNDAGPAIEEGLIVPLYDTGKRPIGTLWVASHEPGAGFDPTDARIMEQLAVQLVLAIKLRRKARVLVQLEETARDKEILVHEVRHRVKNMIQMTSGLLQLQEKAVRSAAARTALREAQTRLLVLASVYESLLQPEADARLVDAGGLIGGLADAIRQTSSCGERVRIRTNCEKLLLGVDQAVPLGLVVNEAVTNALKHAFAGRESGTVCVTLTREGARCTVTVSDDGGGLQGPPREGSLGMRLMRNLARQLKGELNIGGVAGTTVRLAWTLAADHPQREAALHPAE
jgi:two-component sensor histidine kinase